jgi:hypothetical protein
VPERRGRPADERGCLRGDVCAASSVDPPAAISTGVFDVMKQQRVAVNASFAKIAQL